MGCVGCLCKRLYIKINDCVLSLSNQGKLNFMLLSKSIQREDLSQVSPVLNTSQYPRFVICLRFVSEYSYVNLTVEGISNTLYRLLINYNLLHIVVFIYLLYLSLSGNFKNNMLQIVT